MQQRKFVFNLAFLLFLNLLIKPVHVLFIDVNWQNTVHAENFGLYFALFNFSFVLNIILDFGITNFNNKNIAQNSHLLTKHFSSLIILKLLLALIYILIAFIIGLIIKYDFRLMKLMLLLGFNQFLISFIAYLRSNIAGLHLFWVDSIVSVLDRAILITLSCFLLFGNVLGRDLDIMDYVYAQTISYGATVIVAFFIVLNKTHSTKFKISRAFAMMILKKSFPFAVLAMLMACYNRLDTVMIERMLPDGAEQSGIYAQGYRLLDAANMIAFLFAGLLLPIFSRMLKFHESVEALVKTAFILLIVPGIVVAVGCWFYADELMRMLYREHVEQAAEIFPILMSCFVAISTTYIFGTLLTANGNLRELNLMASSGILINVTMNLFLIPKFQAVGSAVSSLTTQLLTALIQVLIAQNVFKFRINYRLLLTLITFFAGVILINYFSKNIHHNILSEKNRWMVNFAFMVIACVIWAFAIRLLSIKSMMRIVKYG
ncbi:MAG: oligosaccharide flippase family protein [Bacteroidetes bacterium]|nr:oligosaccharide flippase family protein [Bacteroidota bacterium]